MKKFKSAEEYLEDAVNKLHYSDQPWFENGVYDGGIRAILEAIKQAQLDAIQITVERCAEETQVDINGDIDDKFSFRDQDGVWCEIKVNKQSILNVATKIKNELNETNK